MNLWSFACALYAEPGIESALIQLQDEHGVSVNHLLAVSWWHARKNGLVDWSEILPEERQRALSEKVVQPIRSFRRSRKGLVNESLYQQLKTLELVAEQAQLRWLEARLISQENTGGSMPEAGNAGNVTLYEALTDYVVANVALSERADVADTGVVEADALDVCALDGGRIAGGAVVPEPLAASLAEFSYLAARGIDKLRDSLSDSSISRGAG